MRNKRARAGEFWSLNTKKVKGHKGRVARVSKTGNVKAVIVTHAPKTHGRKNIKLNKNPDKKDRRMAFALDKPQYASPRQLGTKHPEMKVTDKRDKSIFRHIGKKK